MALLQLLFGLGADEMRRHLGGIEAVEQGAVFGLPGAEHHHPATIGTCADKVGTPPNLRIG